MTTAMIVANLSVTSTVPSKKISTIDELFRHSKLYQNSDAFNELVKFMGRFRDYAPYNNMLVRLQNPSCRFYARARRTGAIASIVA